MRHSPDDTRPDQRALRIFPFDPMLGRAGEYRVTVTIPYRELERTDRMFRDDRLEVVDYDVTSRKYYRVANLDDSRVAMQQGLEPSESDPQFHQQMVYAVASRVLADFDRALGRRLRLWPGERLRLMPHAFQGRNAYYDDQLKAVLFGYFAADDDDPGANLPGQLVFTCLSHDIIAHEVTHAVLHRLRPHYHEATNPDVPALHEAFADLVAIFQRFTFTDVVRLVVQKTRGDLLKPNPLLDVGAQFGAAAGLGAALRSAGGTPDPALLARTRRPHARGRILVCAVFDGFVRTCERRTADLVRLATGGSGRLPEGELHPDLVNRLAMECARTAQSVLSMCIRATDYLPPVDPTFSDFLRAMVTADFDLNQADELGLRAAMIEAFRVRGIRPEAVGSLAVESLLLTPEDPRQPPDAMLADIVRRLLSVGALEMNVRTAAVPPTPSPSATRKSKSVPRVHSLSEWVAQQAPLTAPETEAEVSEADEPDDEWRNLARDLQRWASSNRERLGLDPNRPVQVQGFHPVHRVAPSGELLVEMVAQFVQSLPKTGEDLGGLTFRAGVTMVAMIDGRIRYVIRKPLDAARQAALRDWVAAFDSESGPAWPTGPAAKNRITEAFSLRAIDARRWG